MTPHNAVQTDSPPLPRTVSLREIQELVGAARRQADALTNAAFFI